MFKLTKNNLSTNGVCRYEDENGNKLSVKKTSDGFITRLYPINENIKCEPYTVNLSKNAEGGEFNISILAPIEKEVLDRLIEDFTEIIQRWVELVNAINRLNADPKILAEYIGMDTYNKETEEYISYLKLNDLQMFDETKDIALSLLQSKK